MKNKLTLEIEKVLDELEIKINIRGYRYWITAIKYNMQRDAENDRMKDVYIEVAKHHKTKPARAERAMRLVCYQNKEKIQEYFKTKLNISNSVFLQHMTRFFVNCETGEKVEKC